MAISSIPLSSSAIGAYASQAQGSDAQNNPLATLPNKETATQSQLSAFGKVKLTLDDLRARAQALSNFNRPPTLADFKVAVQGFVQSFNSLQNTVSEANASTKASATVSDLRPNQALSDVRKAVGGPNGDALMSMQKLGVEPQKDGTLAINQNNLDKAFQMDRPGVMATFSSLTDRVVPTIDKQLSVIGNIGGKVQNSGMQVADPESSRNRLQERLDTQKSFQQHLASQMANTGSYVARNAVAFYFSVSAM